MPPTWVLVLTAASLLGVATFAFGWKAVSLELEKTLDEIFSDLRH
jgi:hypothetical protein